MPRTDATDRRHGGRCKGGTAWCEGRLCLVCTGPLPAAVRSGGAEELNAVEVKRTGPRKGRRASRPGGGWHKVVG